jgi:predicted nuclease of restriction endonuclease-like RecB superfamily
MAHMTKTLRSRYSGGTQPAPKMYAELAKPFESIESAHEFVALLEESIQEAVGDVREHLQDAEGASDERQVRALNLALYKLTQLAGQMHKSRRALNDLRSIRRLLFTERGDD